MRYISFILLLFIGVSCKKKKIEDPPVTDSLKNGMLVLCEGLFQQNNSSISWVDFSSGEINNSFFLNKAERALGDTGNEIKRYGGKIYIVVNVSSTIEVLDANTFASIKQISMVSNGISKQPRQITFKGSKAYVTCYDGYVDVIDTTALNVQNRIKVGDNPEGLSIDGNKLFVANSGGLNYPNVDSTLSVIDLTTETELEKITVGINPGSVKVDGNGDVYVISRGDYGAIPSRMVRVDANTNTVIETFPFDASGIIEHGSEFLISYYNNSTSATTLKLFNPSSETIAASDYLDLSAVNTMYNVQSYPSQDRIYIMDAMNYTNSGYVHVYNQSGTFLTSYHVGLNPNSIVVYD